MRVRVGALALMLVVVVGGCTRGGDSGGEGDASSGRLPTGGVLRAAVARPSGVDPGNAFDPAAQLVVRTMCDTLVNIDPETGDVVAGLADSWVVSDNGRKLTLRLRRDLRFSDGSSLGADDVAYSLSRLADARYASELAGLVRLVRGFRVLHGEEEAGNDDSVRSRRLSGIRTISAQGLEIELTEDRADFVNVLAHPATAPVPRRAATDGAEFAARPACVGPYRLAAPWSGADETIALERVPSYKPLRGAPWARGGGWADRIELRLMDGGAARAGAVAAGVVDVAVAGSAPPAAGDGLAVTAVPTPYVEYLAFAASTGDAVWRDPVVRRALSMAVDRQRLADDAWGRSRAPASSFLPDAVGRRWADDTRCDGVPAAADVAAAQSLLAGAGVDLAGRPLTIAFNDELGNDRTAAAVAQQWRDAFGLDVRLQPMSWTEYEAGFKAADGVAGVFRYGWRPDAVDADRYLAPLFGLEGSGSSNVTRYSNPDFQRSLTRGARRAEDPADARADYLRLAELVCRDLPMTPILTGVEHLVVATARVAPVGESVADPVAGDAALRALAVLGR